MGKITIGLDTYTVSKKEKAVVHVQHDIFIHCNDERKPWKIFKRNARETDRSLQQRILDKIAELEKVRTSAHSEPCRYPQVTRTHCSCSVCMSAHCRSIRMMEQHGRHHRRMPMHQLVCMHRLTTASSARC